MRLTLEFFFEVREKKRYKHHIYGGLNGGGVHENMWKKCFFFSFVKILTY